MITLYVIALLCNGNEILFVRRINTSFAQGFYGLIGGKVEEGERALQAVKREVYEEIGLEIPEEYFTLVHTFHRPKIEAPGMSLCFKADISKLPSPKNTEPHKHDDMRFFSLHNLPQNIIPAHKQLLECAEKKIGYAEHGW